MDPWFFYLPIHAIVAIIVGHWVLYPLVRRAGCLKPPSQITIADVICLMAMIQISLACFAPFYSDDWPVWMWIPFLAPFFVCVVAMWGASICVASNAGIVRSWRRVVVILVLIPGTLAVMNLLPIAMVFECSWILDKAFSFLGLTSSQSPPLDLVYGIALLPVIALAWGLRCLAACVVMPTNDGRQSVDVVGVTSLPQGLVEQDGGGDGEVEAVDAAQEGQADRLDVLGPP
jgi:hypothetical protein